MRAGLVEHAIDVTALVNEVADPSCGAVSLFVGTVRDLNDGRAVEGIEYQAYAPMAHRELQSIAAAAVERFDTPRLVVEHRTGHLNVTDISIGIAVAHAHRAPALDATRFVIEEIKRRVPIWKREHYADGTREWTDSTRAQTVAPEFMGVVRRS